jgi:hypothetical protein
VGSSGQDHKQDAGRRAICKADVPTSHVATTSVPAVRVLAIVTSSLHAQRSGRGH